MFGKKNNKKGFTLIEMLVVIAIIAVLVAIVVPLINSSTAKARAATDAANLRTIISQLNVILVSETELAADVVDNIEAPESKSSPGATLMVLYRHPGFIEPYYVTSDSKYYGLDYFSDVATNGTSSISISAPSALSGDQWFTVGTTAESE